VRIATSFTVASMRLITALAVAVAALLVPQYASAARAFKLGNPARGDISVGRVVMTVKPPDGEHLKVRGIRAAGADARMVVAARLRRIGRSRQYVARVVILHSDRTAAAGSARATTRFDVDTNGSVRRSLFEDTRQVNVVGTPKVPSVCFFPQRDAEWKGFAALANGPRLPRRKLDRLTLAARDLLCGRPVPSGFPAAFGTPTPATVFGGVHTPFHNARVEHVFRFHGNDAASSFSIEPPRGGEFVSCAGWPCSIDAGRVLVPGPFTAGEEVELNARATIEIPPRVKATAYAGDRRFDFVAGLFFE
jgi:hypothetical protein